jgi:exodeoxyribonuclease VII small subunit
MMVVKKLTYAQALAEVEDIVSRIQKEEYSIDELAEKVKRVSSLIAFCREKLRETDDEVCKVISGME